MSQNSPPFPKIMAVFGYCFKFPVLDSVLPIRALGKLNDIQISAVIETVYSRDLILE